VVRPQIAGCRRELQSSGSADLKSISDWPAGSPKISDRVRRALAKTFPYAVFYSDESEEIVVLAIRHQAQDPKSWPTGY